MLVLEVVSDALRGIGVISEIETPSAEQGQDGVRKLNELMASLAEDGIDFGFAPVADTSETITLPLGSVATVKALLSVRLSPIYGAEVPPVVGQVASNGYDRLLRQSVLLAQESLSLSTVSHGSGSQYDILTG